MLCYLIILKMNKIVLQEMFSFDHSKFLITFISIKQSCHVHFIKSMCEMWLQHFFSKKGSVLNFIFKPLGIWEMYFHLNENFVTKNNDWIKKPLLERQIVNPNLKAKLGLYHKLKFYIQNCFTNVIAKILHGSC